MQIDNSKIKKILCIKPRGIGDIILSTVILENLAAHFPKAQIDYLTERFARASVENNPFVTKVLTMKEGELSLLVALRIRKEKYDMIIDLWSNPRSAQITFLSGVKYRVGFAYRGRKYAYNILGTSERGKTHSAEHNLELLKPLRVPVNTMNIHFYISEDDDEYGKKFIKKSFREGNLIVGIIPAGGWPSKRCDATKWVEICSSINNRYKVCFLILWGPGDEYDADYIKNHFPDRTVLAPKTSVNEMAGLINNCNFILANDSGPMHMAVALGIPTLGIFGPTDPLKHGPYSKKSDYVIKEDLFCIKCDFLECPYNHECMLQLSNHDIIKKFASILKRNNITAVANEKD
jgi:lipopolysaccharide heptosyltransferase II